MTVEDDWLAKIKETMAIDVHRFRGERLASREIISRLFEIPEVVQAFALRANRRRPLPIEPTTEAERLEIVEALNRIAEWLNDGFHEEVVEQLRGIAADLTSD